MMMPEEEFERYEIYCNYIQMATTLAPGAKIESGFYCECEMKDGELCDGTVEVSQIDVPKQIRWECQKCGDKGAIINYEYTAWDNSHLSDEDKERFLKMVLSDVTAEDFFDDDMYLFEDEEDEELFNDFEYYVNPYDPDAEQTGGPTSRQVRELLESDWTDPDSLIYLNDNIPVGELIKSPFYYNIRQFLLLLQEEKEFPLTRNGYLKRKIVKKLVRGTRWDEPYVDNLKKTKKNIDETDIWLLYGLRLLLDISGLITEIDEKAYRLNEDYVDLLKEENAGKLYRHIFSTYFRDMNLGFFSTTLELPYLQYSVPYILYKLKTIATSWMPVEDFAEEALLFSVKVELDTAFLGEFEDNFNLFYEDVLTALERFGLIETRKTMKGKQDQNILNSYPDQIRITSLLEKFLVFKDME